MLARYLCACGIAMAFSFGYVSNQPLAQSKVEKTFSAVLTDAQELDNDVKNINFYWEEKVSETAFVPHELRHAPVKRGTATVNVSLSQLSKSTSSRV